MSLIRPARAGERSLAHLRTALVMVALLVVLSPASAQHFANGPRRIDERHGPAAGHGRSGVGRSRAALYDILSVDGVTDRAAMDAASARLGPALAGTNGRLLVDADDPITAIGPGPSHVAVIVFDDVGSAQAWQGSIAARSILADLGKMGTVRMVSVGGIADPGARPSVPMASLGPGKSLRVFAVPKIGDICKGC